VVVGVTNVIPFFGPFLGAVPCAFLILLDSPIKCLYFLVFILALQQFDGNILGPKILGDSTGLSSFWVIVAILVGGGLWGVAGMFFGVPLFACACTAVRAYSTYCLKRKGLPTASASYATHEPVWPEESGEKEKEGAKK
jgi:predicted PurR-regulated permease PerM